MAKVYVKFPKTGLGNLLLIWARARLLAELNNLSMVTAPWWGVRWGAWLRNERKKRMYIGYFKESSWVQRLMIKIYYIGAIIVKDPEVKKIKEEEVTGRKLFLFNKVSTSNDIFSEIREHRDFIRDEIYKILSPLLLQKMSSFEVPVIAVHIRRGDFKIGNQITPGSFFTDCISSIRTVCKEDWPVTVFTDADHTEIAEILQLPQVKLAEDKPDILDILLMSKSRVIVLSQSSTFSYWGAFLSDAIVLKPGDDWQKNLRSSSTNRRFPEIRWKENDTACFEQLTQALRGSITR